MLVKLISSGKSSVILLVDVDGVKLMVKVLFFFSLISLKHYENEVATTFHPQ